MAMGSQHHLNQAHDALAAELKAEYDSKVDAIVSECAFAKIVKTASGTAIMIGGEIIDIISSMPALHVEAIVKALRRGGQESVVVDNGPGPIGGAQYNKIADVIRDDASAAMPISAGGTGASEGSAARSNIGIQPINECPCLASGPQRSQPVFSRAYDALLQAQTYNQAGAEAQRAFGNQQAMFMNPQAIPERQMVNPHEGHVGNLCCSCDWCRAHNR